jgi:hypothetical protein
MTYLRARMEELNEQRNVEEKGPKQTKERLQEKAYT